MKTQRILIRFPISFSCLFVLFFIFSFVGYSWGQFDPFLYIAKLTALDMATEVLRTCSRVDKHRVCEKSESERNDIINSQIKSCKLDLTEKYDHNIVYLKQKRKEILNLPNGTNSPAWEKVKKDQAQKIDEAIMRLENYKEKALSLIDQDGEKLKKSCN